MAPPAVRFHPAAAQEVEFTYEWYAARDISAAHGFREELRQAVDAVVASPRTWPRYGRRAPIYLVRGDGVEVVAVAHGRRRPGTGGRDSETPSNKPLERAGTNASRSTDRTRAGRSAPRALGA
jgi:plasmid stabilization system protein ParE